MDPSQDECAAQKKVLLCGNAAAGGPSGLVSLEEVTDAGEIEVIGNGDGEKDDGDSYGQGDEEAPIHHILSLKRHFASQRKVTPEGTHQASADIRKVGGNGNASGVHSV